MNITPITDLNDVRLARYRDVADSERMRGHGVFVAEGRTVVARTLGDPRYHIESMLVSPAARMALGSALDRASNDVSVFECPTNAFRELTGINFHRGCLALVRRPAPVPWQEIVRHARLLVILEGVTDPDNVGSVFRNAAAFGADGVLLSPTCCDPLYRKAIRTSMGHALGVAFARIDASLNALDELRGDGWTVVALSPRAPAMPLDDYLARRDVSRTALLIGTEGEGLSTAAEGRATCRVRIPMISSVDSVNLAVASGIALSRLYAQEVSCMDARRNPDQDA